MVGRSLPFKCRPKRSRRKKTRHGINLSLNGAVPKRIGPCEGQGAHKTGAQNRNILAQRLLAANQFFGKHRDGPKQKRNRESRRESACEIDPISLARHVAQGELRHDVGNELKHGSARRVAYLKLDGKVSGQPITFKGQHLLNLLLLIAFFAASVLVFLDPSQVNYIVILIVISLLLGILTVIPIGGADMPVVISLLNSYSGMAACATGFILSNNVLIVAGSLVGASGIILTQIMCKAMNRSLVNVLLGGFGQTVASGGEDGPAVVVKEIGVEETAMLFDSASSVIVVPGYGMAVAQAQHVIRELMEQCEKRNINFRFAIHPVAGRMPGHMNVLLAEANISYDKLIEMDDINEDFSNTDLVFVVGANDVVNPAARTNPQSPIFGMPILNADKARTVIVSKRSMGKGYAGVENELFGYPNCLMLFGDAKQTITKVVSEMKDMA